MTILARVSAGMLLVGMTFVFTTSAPEPAFARNQLPTAASGIKGSKKMDNPGPIAGAGLPFLAAGYGVYWLVKRRRNKTA